jgi:hypothetical protein
VKWQHCADAFPWRITAFLALFFGLPLVSLGTWITWELLPLQRYYLRAYLDSTEGANHPGATTQIEWLFKTAPGRKSLPIIAANVVSGQNGNLPFHLAPSAIAQGWAGIERSPPQRVNSGELEQLLQEEFYDSRGFWQLVAEPLLEGCVFQLLPVFWALVMKEELAHELSRLRREVTKPEPACDYPWELPVNRHWIAGWIWLRMAPRKWLPKLPQRRAHPFPKSLNIDAIRAPIVGSVENDRAPLRALVQQPDPGPNPTGNALSVNPRKKPVKRQFIFPGKSGVRASSQKPKPWDDSQWID